MNLALRAFLRSAAGRLPKQAWQTPNPCTSMRVKGQGRTCGHWLRARTAHGRPPTGPETEKPTAVSAKMPDRRTLSRLKATDSRPSYAATRNLRDRRPGPGARRRCSTLRAELTSRPRTRPQPSQSCTLSASVFGLPGSSPHALLRRKAANALSSQRWTFRPALTPCPAGAGTAARTQGDRIRREP